VPRNPNTAAGHAAAAAAAAAAGGSAGVSRVSQWWQQAGFFSGECNRVNATATATAAAAANHTAEAEHSNIYISLHIALFTWRQCLRTWAPCNCCEAVNCAVAVAAG
jgi:hypothetical protein